MSEKPWGATEDQKIDLITWGERLHLTLLDIYEDYKKDVILPNRNDAEFAHYCLVGPTPFPNTNIVDKYELWSLVAMLTGKWHKVWAEKDIFESERHMNKREKEDLQNQAVAYRAMEQIKVDQEASRICHEFALSLMEMAPEISILLQTEWDVLESKRPLSNNKKEWEEWSKYNADDNNELAYTISGMITKRWIELYIKKPREEYLEELGDELINEMRAKENLKGVNWQNAILGGIRELGLPIPPPTLVEKKKISELDKKLKAMKESIP